MELPANLRQLAEALVPPKPGMIVGVATERLVTGGSLPESAYELLAVPEWRAFCHSVWHAEMPGPCKLITRHIAPNGGPPDAAEMHHCAAAPSVRTRPIIEVGDDGLTQLWALHEIAHLLVEEDVSSAHGPVYVEKFVDLLGRWVSPKAANDWVSEWAAVLAWAQEHDAWPPPGAARRNPP
jgi:hypothetical protein